MEGGVPPLDSMGENGTANSEAAEKGGGSGSSNAPTSTTMPLKRKLDTTAPVSTASSTSSGVSKDAKSASGDSGVAKVAKLESKESPEANTSSGSGPKSNSATAEEKPNSKKAHSSKANSFRELDQIGQGRKRRNLVVSETEKRVLKSLLDGTAKLEDITLADLQKETKGKSKDKGEGAGPTKAKGARSGEAGGGGGIGSDGGETKRQKRQQQLNKKIVEENTISLLGNPLLVPQQVYSKLKPHQVGQGLHYVCADKLMLHLIAATAAKLSWAFLILQPFVVGAWW